ncbi:homogentisate phytyltransferase [Solirubrobacter soli]|uniref:homogentisate phytyltransferase n=1 Tax=Solirubrobacter soli TaxID=363832 RepID=UPI0003F7AFE1|nr:homogentisate phytyltransferase [Solirubrobacter soli]
MTIAAAITRANPFGVLWRFARPHTIIGTTLSVVGLWAISENARGVGDLAATLLVGLMVNIAIVGVNQITDVEIDRINKPFLPIAAGDLSLGSARTIVLVCTVVPLVLALTQGWVETAAVATGLAVGAVYSLPPLRLKRFPVAASLCITGVRSLVVNLGVYWHFAGRIDAPVWALCLFVLPFSFAIAVLKDVPDIEGDRAYSIRTFTVRLGGQRVFQIGLAALALAYAGMIFVAPFALANDAQPVVLVVGHLAAAGLLWYFSRAADPRDREGFTRFYMRVWALFFLEYLIVPIACLSG